MKKHFIVFALVIAFLMAMMPATFAQNGEPTFTDVPADHPFFAEIEALAAAGVTEGWPDGTYRPSQPFTRMAAAAFLYRGLEVEDADVDEPTFTP